MSVPRSNREDASDLRPRRLLVPADRRGLEVGALERHQPGAGPDLGLRASHHARHRLRADGVSDDEHSRFELPLLAVQRADRLAGARAPRPQLAPGQPLEVEGVHGVPRLEQDVVGDVHEIVDRTDPGGGQAVGEPRGRGADLHLGDGRGVPRAEVHILGRHLEPLCGDRRGRGRGQRAGHADGAAGRVPRQAQGHPARRGRLARQAGDAQAVGPVRGDLEVDHRVAGAVAGRPGRGLHRVDRGDLEPLHRQQGSQFWSRQGDVGQVTEPGDQEFQKENCSRKRRSFS